MGKYKFARVTGGECFEHLKDIDLYGRTDGKKFYVFGCKDEDQERFYKGILEFDNRNQIHGFKSIEEVKEYWEESGDMFLTIEEGQYEIVEEKKKILTKKVYFNGIFLGETTEMKANLEYTFEDEGEEE